MTKTILVATVAALALISPAHAERGGKGKQQAEQGEARGGGGGQQAQQQQQQQRAERPQRAERVQMQRAERPQRAERVQMQRAERPQRAERVQMQRAERPQRAERVQMQRPQRTEQFRAERQQRPQRMEQFRAERQQRAEQMRAQRQQRIRTQQPQRQQRFAIERPQREQRVRMEQVQRQRREARFDNAMRQRERSAQRLDQRQRSRADRMVVREQRAEQRLAAQQAKRQQKFDQRYAAQQFKQQKRDQRLASAATLSSGEWFDGYAAQRYQTQSGVSSGYAYDYNPDNGYLYQIDADRNYVAAMIPVLGGAFSVGQPLPIGYSDYNVPYAYRDLYYDTPDYAFRYGDGAIYRVDPTTQLIQGVVALLTGQRFGVGQMLPAGYGAYNLPYAYRDDYYDTDDAWYRYGDGYIYQVDPYTGRIVRLIPTSYGNSYAVGYPVPAYASYGGYGGYGGYPAYAGYSSYNVPYGYRSLYYDAPGANYHYANGGIYQVNPLTQLITALVAVVTGSQFNVGQMMPAGYGAYNVPYAYRDDYYDTDDAWYRYDDGYIYQVDPRTRLVETMIPVAYDGYAVGYPVPSAYPGYAVPATYDDLYYAQPGYDYRYFDGGIYEIDRDTRLVHGIPALVTGHDLAVGQPLPVGYDVYNVPYAYRDRYYDSADSWYRYADGHVYQVDPTTRLVTAIIDAIA